MSRYLIKTTDVYRVDTLAEVEQFHSELKNDANFELGRLDYQKKKKKKKGEIVDEYCLVTVKKIFNCEKEPMSNIDIAYEKESLF